MGSVPKCEIAIDYEYDRFTHPLPRTVPTVSKRHVLTFEAKPNETDDSQWHPHCLKSRVSSIPPFATSRCELTQTKYAPQRFLS
jgi:hypothetical protein